MPEGRPHRFLKRSDRPMAMIWVHAGDEPERTLVDPGSCEGVLPLDSLPRRAGGEGNGGSANRHSTR